MIVIHQGIDIVELARFRNVTERNADFLEEVFTEGEREYCLSQKNAALHFAGRFAAKEACLKALGLGLSSGGMGEALRNIEITRRPSGAPGLSLKGWPASLSRRKKIYQQTVSISHTESAAVATVVMVAEINNDLKKFLGSAPSPQPSPSGGEGYNIAPPLRGGDEGEGV